MTSDEKHENQENKDIQSNTLDQETRANSNSTERTDTEKVEKTEQQTTNENLEAESDTELPPKPEGKQSLKPNKLKDMNMSARAPSTCTMLANWNRPIFRQV